MATVQVMLNYLGLPVDSQAIDWTFKSKDPITQAHYGRVAHVLELPPESLPQEVLARYADVSTSEFYNPIWPYTEKLVQRFLHPLKSAKRLYCLGEFLACIEICAHLSEMLVQLIWEMSNVGLTEEEEKMRFGSTFEKLSQQKRIDVLADFKLIEKKAEEDLNLLRVTRRKYFHLWFADVAAAVPDARKSFARISSLVRDTLKIEYVDGGVKMNPALMAYVQKHNAASISPLAHD